MTKEKKGKLHQKFLENSLEVAQTQSYFTTQQFYS